MASFNMISELKPFKTSWKIQAKILRAFRQVTTYGETLELILCDATGQKIGATIKKQFIPQFQALLIEGETRIIRTFAVGQPMAAYKATDHPYKISFYQTTVVQPCEQLPSELTGWSFARFEDIMEGKLGIEYLVDIIGQIVTIGEIIPYDNNRGEKKKRIVVELRNSEDTRLSCTLFDEYAEEINQFVRTENNNDVILVAQFCRMSLYHDVWSVTNAFNNTKIFFNPTHPKVTEFTNSLPQDGLALSTKRQHQYHCLLVTEEFFSKNPPKNLKQLRETEEQGKFVVMCEIMGIVADMGWFYISCKTCHKKVVPRDNVEDNGVVFFCEKCGKEIKDVIPRFLLHLRVKDHSVEATMVVFDKDAMLIVQRTAAELAETTSEMVDPTVLPPALTLLTGHTYMFIVSVERANVVWKHDNFKVLRIARPRLMNQILNSMSQTINMSQTITISDNTQGETSVQPIAPDARTLNIVDDETLPEERTPCSKRKVLNIGPNETSDYEGIINDVPDRNSAVKKICLVTIKKEKSE